MSIELLGLPTTLGMPRNALRHGPDVLRSAGIVEQLRLLDLTVTDLGNLTMQEGRVEDTVDIRVQKVADAAHQQADFWLARHQRENLMLTLGGDHSTTLGTILALSRMNRSFDTVWIDAHGDFNIIETSPSGNPHGMVLAMACGLIPSLLPQAISPASLHLWGVRDVDPGERDLLAGHRVKTLSPAQVRAQRDQLLHALQRDVLLSFDIDSIDPHEAPGTMTPVPDGFSAQEALDLVAALSQRCRLLAVDIVEFHPDLDHEGMTAELVIRVAQQTLAGQANFVR